MKNFALIGAAGYVAPRHMKAIRDTGNRLIAAFDPNDSVGVIDTYFPDAAFFVEFERFDRHLEKLRRQGTQVDFVSICSPNYLHDAHVRFALRYGADAICEKPVVLNPWNIDALQEIEYESGRTVHTILQLRLHPALAALHTAPPPGGGQRHTIDLTYITARGRWYYASWKGDETKSGGIVTNIGVHLFDLLSWTFGAVQHMEVHQRTHDRAAGFVELERARVRWFLSINPDTLPATLRDAGVREMRTLEVDGRTIDLSAGFADLHTKSYAEIMAGRGYTLDDTRAAIQLVHDIRHAPVTDPSGTPHPLAMGAVPPHPFLK